MILAQPAREVNQDRIPRRCEGPSGPPSLIANQGAMSGRRGGGGMPVNRVRKSVAAAGGEGEEEGRRPV